jgi:hypothetical protein
MRSAVVTVRSQHPITTVWGVPVQEGPQLTGQRAPTHGGVRVSSRR